MKVTTKAVCCKDSNTAAGWSCSEFVDNCGYSFLAILNNSDKFGFLAVRTDKKHLSPLSKSIKNLFYRPCFTE